MQRSIKRKAINLNRKAMKDRKDILIPSEPSQYLNYSLFLWRMQLAAGNFNQPNNEKQNQSFCKRDEARGNLNCTGFPYSKVSDVNCFSSE